ncbi:myosin light chain kinase 2, skeletal/cardiac muscle-like [Brienomyrus brachyistius]|uniref:myosin light chain kinase 2, skeletal/cardiac muscle-like n=1 Tax=Brienomyrus brachyistius TaxID=42636 RepID=UPI0020B3CA83|nr:myosin light chain kinase 2, skeletal/cardiac muscle-like [Brienomyrus brachyistius]
MSSKVVNSLAKVFDPKSVSVMGKPGKLPTEVDGHPVTFSHIQTKIDSLSDKIDKLIHIQEKVLHRLDGLSQDIDGIEKDVETLKVDKEEIHLLPPKQQDVKVTNEMKVMCQEMNSVISAVSQRSEQHSRKLDGMERLMMGIQQVVSLIGENVKTSCLMELLFKDPPARKARATTNKLREHRGRANLKASKSQKKKKSPDTPEIAALRKQVQLLEEVQRFNWVNAERLHQDQQDKAHEVGGRVDDTLEEESYIDPTLINIIPDAPRIPVGEEVGVSGQKGKKITELDKLGRDKPLILIKRKDEDDKWEGEPGRVQVHDEVEAKEEEEEEEEEEQQADMAICDSEQPPDNDGTEPKNLLTENGPAIEAFQSVNSHEKNIQVFCELMVELNQTSEGISYRKSDVTKGDLEKDEHVKDNDSDMTAQMEEEEEEEEKERMDRAEVEMEESDVEEDAEETEEYFIDCSPPPSAPFKHRVVSAKPNQISNFYAINKQEILGGGRFGQVHKCIENSSGLTFAAKIIKGKSPKEKDFVKNEIQVMNQLDHANLIQLYAAYESRTEVILVLEYVDGGELFDRIIDENYKLTELDSVMFIRQICDGIQHMHKMYILHLDLKPENIMCVSRITNKIKIIDFGLARKYNPQEKLKVSFGTPEFLAPEVVNYDYVSFSTDMWSLGVITYMLLSSLSPFLGDDNNETLNNILACQWSFQEVEFTDISEEAKDFISKLLVVNKSWRISASEALRHAWLSDPVLHHHLHEKKNMCRSRRSSCVTLCNP